MNWVGQRLTENEPVVNDQRYSYVFIAQYDTNDYNINLICGENQECSIRFITLHKDIDILYIPKSIVIENKIYTIIGISEPYSRPQIYNINKMIIEPEINFITLKTYVDKLYINNHNNKLYINISNKPSYIIINNNLIIHKHNKNQFNII